MKQELEKLSHAKRDEENTENAMEIQKRITRQASSNNRTSDQICIFCEIISKYQKSSKTRDPLIKCCDLRANDSIRKSAIVKGDSRIIGVLSRKIVAAEAWYHRSCYRDYTQPEKKSSKSTSAKSKASDNNEDNHGDIESQGYEKLFYFIRCDLLENPRLMTMIELKEMLLILMCSMGATQLSESSKKNF